MIDLAGDKHPARPAHLARLLVALGVGVRFGFPVIIAALAGVMRVSHGIICPEGHIDSGKLSEVGHLLEIIGGEPAGFYPCIEGLDRLPLGDVKREQAFRADHRGGVGARGILKVRGAERALLRLDVVFKEHHRAAAGTADFAGAAGDGAGVRGDLGQGLGVIVLGDLNLRGGDFLDVTAVGAFERAATGGGGVKIEACAAIFARKFAAIGRRIGHHRRRRLRNRVHRQRRRGAGGSFGRGRGRDIRRWRF